MGNRFRRKLYFLFLGFPAGYFCAVVPCHLSPGSAQASPDRPSSSGDPAEVFRDAPQRRGPGQEQNLTCLFHNLPSHARHAAKKTVEDRSISAKVSPEPDWSQQSAHWSEGHHSLVRRQQSEGRPLGSEKGSR